MRRILGLLVLLSVLAVSCGSSGAPIAYDDSVEEAYLNGCRVALDDEQYQNVEAVCQCAYDEIARTIPFEDFVGLNERLRDDINVLKEQDSIGTEALQIVSECIRPAGGTNQLTGES